MTHEFTLQLVAVTCTACGCTFGLEAHHHAKLREKGDTFYCPNGHPRAYRESDLQKLEKQLARERAQHDQTKSSRDFWRQRQEAEKRRAAAARGQVTKIKNRVGNGVCPCCNRTFQNLQRHMATKHPAWRQDDGGGA